MEIVLKRLVDFIGEYASVCADSDLSTAAAALSYFLTLTFFPLIICLYTLLGSNYDKAFYILGLVGRLLPESASKFFSEFLIYVSQNYSGAMLATGIAVLVSSSSAAVRSLQGIIGKMQGGQRYHGMKDLLFSLIISIAFIAAIYFAVLVMLTGEVFLNYMGKLFPLLDTAGSWNQIRFVILAGIEFVIINGVFAVSKRNIDSYSTVPGAAFSSFAMVAVSILFSVFISASAKYPLVYGSLATIILLMFWLYLCCWVIYLGAALNIAIRNWI